VHDLAAALALRRLEADVFEGRSPDPGLGRIFGGQVIAQSLVAAYETIEDRVCHSLHAYFERPGDPSIPVRFEVSRPRDGKSFATRRISAMQRGEQILGMTASFQILEDGYEHQSTMPLVPPPEIVPTERELRAPQLAAFPPEFATRMLEDRPIEMRFIDPRPLKDPQPTVPVQHHWFRAYAPVPDTPARQQAVLAYASDMNFLDTCMRPHGINWFSGKIQSASLDHAIWFHRPIRINDWHLYVSDSPSASGARGFNRGSIFSRDGRLVASVAQEGLIRRRG